MDLNHIVELVKNIIPVILALFTIWKFFDGLKGKRKTVITDEIKYSKKLFAKPPPDPITQARYVEYIYGIELQRETIEFLLKQNDPDRAFKLFIHAKRLAEFNQDLGTIDYKKIYKNNLIWYPMIFFYLSIFLFVIYMSYSGLNGLSKIILAIQKLPNYQALAWIYFLLLVLW